MFVNTFNLLELVRNPNLDRKTIICNVAYSERPIRNPKSKWYITQEEYAPDIYKTYCYGYFSLIPNEIYLLLNQAMPFVPFVWLEDVWTGLVGYKINAQYASPLKQVIRFGEKSAVDRVESIYGMHTEQNIPLLKEICNAFLKLL